MINSSCLPCWHAQGTPRAGQAGSGPGPWRSAERIPQPQAACPLPMGPSVSRGNRMITRDIIMTTWETRGYLGAGGVGRASSVTEVFLSLVCRPQLSPSFRVVDISGPRSQTLQMCSLGLRALPLPSGLLLSTRSQRDSGYLPTGRLLLTPRTLLPSSALILKALLPGALVLSPRASLSPIPSGEGGKGGEGGRRRKVGPRHCVIPRLLSVPSWI